MAYATIGEALRGWRTAAKLRQSDVEDALGIDQTTLSSWEGGRNRASVAELTRLAKHYGVSAEELGQALFGLQGASQAPADSLHTPTGTP